MNGTSPNDPNATARVADPADADGLLRQVAALRDEVDELRARVAPSASAAEEPEPEATMPRRQLLRRAGAVAVGGAAGALVSTIGSAAPASANNGQNLVLGQSNTATVPTILTGGAFPQPSAYFFVHDPADPVGAPFPENAAIAATAVGARHGVEGTSFNTFGSGVYGIGAIGRAVGVRAGGVGANLQLDPGGDPPSARTDAHVVGQIIDDGNGDLWLCVASGSPGVWRKLGGPSAAGAFHALAAPVRVYDSRPGSPPANVTKGQLGNAASRVIDAKNNGSGVPAGATAVMANLTVTKTSAQGFLALFKNGIAWPGTSSINWDHAGQTIANMSVVALDANALSKAYVNQGCACDFLVDVVGYWR